MSFIQTTKKLTLIFIFNILLFEILSLCLIHSLAFIRPDLRLDLTIEQHFSTITDEDFTSFKSNRDQILGWDRKPFQQKKEENSAGDLYISTFGADGARIDPLDHHKALIATYGDSFTEGAEVNNDETWQFYLEELIRIMKNSKIYSKSEPEI